MFKFNSHLDLLSAVDKLTNIFSGAFSEYKIVRDGVLGGETFGEGIEDRWTEDVKISFDSQTPNESWHEFLARMDIVKSDCQVAELGVRTQCGGVHAGGLRDVGELV